MTKDEAGSVGVRIEVAMSHLKDAQARLPVPIEGEDAEMISDFIEEALQSLQTAFALCKNISGA